jgi:dTDP-4-amino-4,6-dideoxygalactose transaminase
MTQIKFLDLKKINDPYRNQLQKAFERVLDSGRYINGQELENFEKEFSEYCGVRYCIGVGNGLDALSIILKSWMLLGFLKKGDEVIVPSNTFIATALAVTNLGLNLVLAEPHPATYNLTVESIQSVRTNKTKVILTVHLYGRISPVDNICAYAEEHGLRVLEDAAQAHGASINTKKAGSFGDAAAFSFYPGKNLGALGDAGGITTGCSQTHEVARAIANYGSDKKYEHKIPGVNSRMDELQAAFLRIKLQKIECDINQRRKIARIYNFRLRNELIELPAISENRLHEHVYHLYVIKTSYRDLIQKYLAEHGIETIIHYPIPISQQDCYSHLSFQPDSISETLSSKILSLPMGSHLTSSDAEKICDILNNFKPS